VEPYSFLKYQMAPRLNMSSESNKKERRYAFSFSLKSPSKRTPPGSPTGALWKELPFTSSFLHISQIPYKILLNKEIYPFPQRPYERSDLHVPQKRGPYRNRRPFPEPYLAYLSESPVKEPSLQVPLIQLPWREIPYS
jgi:hypothetical protein